MRTFLSTLALVLGFWCVVSAQTTLPAPTFSPEPGTYAEATKVTITCEGASYIYYTTDGTNPTRDSPVYTGAINITQTTDLRAFAVADEFGDSAVARWYYAIE